MLRDPRTGAGIVSWMLLGVSGAIMALLIAYLIPGVIPAQSAATRL
jgi:hypothetical protein